MLCISIKYMFKQTYSTYIFSSFQVLYFLPLEYLSNDLTSDIFLASLTTLLLLKPEVDQDSAILNPDAAILALMVTCFDVMRVVLDSLKNGVIYEELELVELMVWMMEYMQGLPSQVFKFRICDWFYYEKV